MGALKDANTNDVLIEHIESIANSLCGADEDAAYTGDRLRHSLGRIAAFLRENPVANAGDFSLTFADVSESGNADRQYNTDKISSVTEEDGLITITLSAKVSTLKDFDGGNGWGIHKWLGIGISADVSPITGLKYNGAALTADDVTEATACSLSAGYFVRWVAADLVLAGDNTQKSKGYFHLWKSGCNNKQFTLKIVEPS